MEVSATIASSNPQLVERHRLGSGRGRGLAPGTGVRLETEPLEFGLDISAQQIVCYEVERALQLDGSPPGAKCASSTDCPNRECRVHGITDPLWCGEPLNCFVSVRRDGITKLDAGFRRRLSRRNEESREVVVWRGHGKMLIVVPLLRA
jgi:hypothetical protein